MSKYSSIRLLSMHTAIKARNPQYEWIKYGVQDKR